MVVVRVVFYFACVQIVVMLAGSDILGPVLSLSGLGFMIAWEKNDHGGGYEFKDGLLGHHSSASQKPISDPDSKFAPSLLQLPRRTVDATHFLPFVKLHAKRGRPERAAGILKDMVRFELSPGVVQWSIVARGFAEYGDPAMAVSIIERLEEHDGSQVRAGVSGDHADRPPSILDIGLYTNVLRGFVLARRLEHAQDTEQRIRQRFEYVDGKLRATDDALRLLRNLERHDELIDAVRVFSDCSISVVFNMLFSL
ncbi:hypothetical protein BDR07DRAFT_1380181 [Suillus spraguei]|nr:hypothetical protein BDR07DRAFT_1380181 [Suillus spraguei]